MTRCAVAAAWCVVVASSACMVGPPAKGFPPATGPQGISADFRFKGKSRRIQGEVLETQDSAFVLLSANRVVVVPLNAIALGIFTRRRVLIESGRISPRTLDWLKHVSRFPGGLTPEIRAKLLAANGQTEPDRAP